MRHPRAPRTVRRIIVGLLSKHCRYQAFSTFEVERAETESKAEAKAGQKAESKLDLI